MKRTISIPQSHPNVLIADWQHHFDFSTNTAADGVLRAAIRGINRNSHLSRAKSPALLLPDTLLARSSAAAFIERMQSLFTDIIYYRGYRITSSDNLEFETLNDLAETVDALKLTNTPHVMVTDIDRPLDLLVRQVATIRLALFASGSRQAASTYLEKPLYKGKFPLDLVQSDEGFHLVIHTMLRALPVKEH